MFLDKPASEKELADAIKNNVCDRNKELTALIKILNYMSRDSAIIALDGEWGSGKTYLVKQLELLWRNSKISIENAFLSHDDLNNFRNRFIPFYYNAWENDYALDPGQSLLAALAESLDEYRNIIEKSERKLVGSVVNGSKFIKNITKGLVDPDNLDTNKETAQYAPEVNRSAKRREKISELINKKIEISDECRLLFIIDDLDRCRPSYAIRLIETIKNSFNNDKIMFLIATNFSELGRIVQGYYGGYIDGYQYLDRIFDLRIGINNVDPEHYIDYKMPDMQNWVMKNVATKLKLSMRETNRFLSIVKLCENYLGNDPTFDRPTQKIYRFVLMPIFIGYKIRSYEIFAKLMSGDGYKYISNFLNDDKEMMSYIMGILNAGSDNIEAIRNAIKKSYDEIFSEYSADGGGKWFLDMINLTSSTLNLE